MIKFWITVQAGDGSGQQSREINEDDLLGVITGRFSEYTMLVNPADPLSYRVTLKRVQEPE